MNITNIILFISFYLSLIDSNRKFISLIILAETKGIYALNITADLNHFSYHCDQIENHTSMKNDRMDIDDLAFDFFQFHVRTGNSNNSRPKQ